MSTHESADVPPRSPAPSTVIAQRNDLNPRIAPYTARGARSRGRVRVRGRGAGSSELGGASNPDTTTYDEHAMAYITPDPIPPFPRAGLSELVRTAAVRKRKEHPGISPVLRNVRAEMSAENYNVEEPSSAISIGGIASTSIPEARVVDEDYQSTETADLPGTRGVDEYGPTTAVGDQPEMRGTEEELQDADAGEARAFGGGPEIGYLLLSFETHRSRYIWDAFSAGIEEKGDDFNPAETEVKLLRFHTRPRTYYSKLLQGNEIDPQSVASLSHLARLAELDWGRLDFPVCHAFIEHWHPETNSFHFSFGEMSITLHDVSSILSLPIDGLGHSDIAKPEARAAAFARVFHITENEAHLLIEKSESILTTAFCGEKKPTAGGRDPLFKNIANDPNELNPLSHQAAAYLFVLLGSTLFVDKSTNRIKDWILLYVEDPTSADQFSWGAAMLAYLYRELGIASRAGTATVAGAAMILQNWIWSYFPTFQGHASEKPSDRTDSRAARRNRRVKGDRDRTRLINIRRELDTYTADKVVWMPWGRPDLEGEHRMTLFRGLLQCDIILEPYMPDRFLRQIGFTQIIPMDPISPSIARRGRNDRTYNVKFSEEVQSHYSWDHRADQILPVEAYHPTAYGWDVDEHYLDWFLHGHTR